MNIGYKALRNSLIAKLEILGINNEMRPGIVKKKYAKYRTDKAKVIKLIHRDTKEEMIMGTSISDGNFVYQVGHTIQIPDFDKDLTRICAPGIHYFKSYEAAYHYIKPDDYFTGFRKMWYNSGQIEAYWKYNKGMLSGKNLFWHENGTLVAELNYTDGILNGRRCAWYTNGKMENIMYYLNGQLHGICKEFDEDGTLVAENLYEYGNIKTLP